MENDELIEKYIEFKKTTNRSKKGIISKNILKLYKYRERVITEDEYNKLLNYATSSLHKAIIETLWITGGRRMAVQSIKSDGVWYDGEFTHVVLSQSKTETREVIYENRAEHLLLWSESLQPFKNQEGKPLFAVRKIINGKEEYKQVNPSYTYVFLQRIAKKAGLNRKVSVHDFRHSKCTQMLRDGVPKNHVKKLMGFNKNTRMLKIYDHNKLKDYEGWLKDTKKESKPTYKTLEKQKNAIEEKHEKEIQELQKQRQEIDDLRDDMETLMKKLLKQDNNLK